jgi:hypothetical protein
MESVNLIAKVFGIHRVIAFPSKAPICPSPFLLGINHLILADTSLQSLNYLLVGKAILTTFAFPLIHGTIIVIGLSLDNLISWAVDMNHEAI